MKILCWIEIGLQSPEYFCFFFLCFHILLTCENVFEQNKGLVFVLMSIAFFCDWKVQTHPNDDQQEENVQETDNQQWFLNHQQFWERVFQVEIMNVILNEVLFLEHNHRATECIQIGVVQLIRQSCYRVRGNEFDVGAALGQDDLDGGLIDDHVIVNMIDQTQFQ